MYGEIISEKSGYVFSIVINRPKKLNALSTSSLLKIIEALKFAEIREDIRLVVIRGMGEKSFSTGFELNNIPTNKPETIHEMVKPFLDLLLLLHKYSKPVVCIVSGYAIGAGCILSTASDITIATKNAKFALPELGLGIGALLTPVIDSIGKRKTIELFLTRKSIDAERALEIGLINHVVKDIGEVDNNLEIIVKSLLGNVPNAVNSFLPALRSSISLDYENSLKQLNLLNNELMLGKEFMEKVKSFN